MRKNSVIDHSSCDFTLSFPLLAILIVKNSENQCSSPYNCIKSPTQDIFFYMNKTLIFILLLALLTIPAFQQDPPADAEPAGNSTDG